MKLNKIVREYQGMIISAGILIISGIGILLGVVPFVRKTIDMNTQLNSVSAEVDVLKNKVSVLQSIDEVSMRSSVQVLLSAVPSDKSISTLLGTLDGLSAKSGVAAGNFSLSKLGSLATESAQRLSADEQAVGGNIVPFTVNISGTLEQIRGFLTTSVSVRRILRVRTIDVSFPKTESESTAAASIASATLGMDTFYSPLPSAIGSVSQPLTALTSLDDDMIAKVSGMQLLVPLYTPLPSPAGGPAKADPFSL
jgi:Tfp pilus assembly protein PilO